MRPNSWLPGAVLLAAGGMLIGQEAKPDVTDPEKVVQEQVEAYNRQDLAAFLKTYSPDVKLYGFPDEELGAGREHVRATYGKMFTDKSDLRVKIAKRIVQGDRVIDHEEVSGIRRDLKAVAI